MEYSNLIKTPEYWIELLENCVHRLKINSSCIQLQDELTNIKYLIKFLDEITNIKNKINDFENVYNLDYSNTAITESEMINISNNVTNFIVNNPDLEDIDSIIKWTPNRLFT